jgi:hypothetical protein
MTDDRQELPEPEAGEDARPWEEPGGVRRDCQPHRGNLLLLLAWISLVLGALTPFFILPALLSFILGAITERMVNKDLKRMRRGLLDPNGEAQARKAAKLARAAVIVTLLGFLADWGLCMCFSTWVSFR